MLLKTIYIPKINHSVEFMIGTNAADNFKVIDESNPTDLWFHIENDSSAHIVAKIHNKLDRKGLNAIIKQGSQLCKQFYTKGNTDNICVVYCKIHDIQKTDIPGKVIIQNYKTYTF